jgi:hypothetical protein
MRQDIESPLDDLTYDVITVLQNKAKALEAYDRYIRDAEDDAELRELFGQMRDQDEAHVRVLKEALARRLLDEDLDIEDDEEPYDEDDEDEVEETDDAASSSNEQEERPRRGESTQRRL